MPRVEFESDEQKDIFLNWLSIKVGREEAQRLEVAHSGYTMYGKHEIWLVGNEPLVISKDFHTASHKLEMHEALVSERHAEELKKSGVIFERDLLVPGPSGSSESRSTQVFNAGKPREYAPGNNPTE